MKVIKEGYTMLTMFGYGLDFGEFTENKQGERVVSIHDDVHDAHLEMLEHYKDSVKAVKNGDMEDFDYNCEIAVVKEFEDGSFIAFDIVSNAICSTTKKELS